MKEKPQQQQQKVKRGQRDRTRRFTLSEYNDITKNLQEIKNN